MLCVHLIEKQQNMRLKVATAEAIMPHASFTICVVPVLISYIEHIDEASLLLQRLSAGMP